MKYLQQILQSRWGGAAAVILAALLTRLNAGATTVTTIAGGPPDALGYVDGETTVDSRFDGPMGMAIDSEGQNLYVADYYNNAVRVLSLGGDETTTLEATSNSHPIGVAIDQSDDIYVLNYGNGTNGMVLEYDAWGDVLTNATSLWNVGGITVDFSGDIYVTSGNQVIRIVGSVATSVATITYPGTLLTGITVMNNGLLAVADYGRNGIYDVNPYTGIVTTNTGFNGAGDAFGPANRAKFLSPFGLISVGNDSLIVADYGNNRVKVVSSTGTVTNLYGVDSNYWQAVSFNSPTPGLFDGTVSYGYANQNYNVSNNVEARGPVGFAMDSGGTLYTSEYYYSVIRTVTSANLPLPPTPPAQVASPEIGIVTFVYDTTLGAYVSQFNPIANGGTTNLYNDAIIAISGPNGAQTYYDFSTNYPVINLSDPTPASSAVPYFYTDGTYESTILGDPLYNGSMVAPAPNLTIEAMSAAPGAPSSDVVSAQINFITQNPFINGNDAAQFSISDATANAVIWYTTDGSDPNPTNVPSSISVTAGSTLSLEIAGTNLLVKARAFTAGFQPSATVSNLFLSTVGYNPNTISLGFASGEASSDFVGSPGQYFVAPVTLTVLPGQSIYGMVFNITVTNLTASPPIVPFTYGFNSFLMKPAPAPAPAGSYVPIPPYMFVDSGAAPPGNSTNYDGAWFQNLVTTDTNGGENLLSAGWIERYSDTNLYNTLGQTLISYSMAHDVMHLSSAGQIEIGAYGFQVPTNAVLGNGYQLQINRASANSDGIGAPGSAVFVAAPTNGSLSALKNLTVAQRKYVAGSVYPFRWFNAGDFGSTNIVDSDLEQVYESALSSPVIYNVPPTNTDMYDALDSCGSFGVLDGDSYDPNYGYYTNAYTPLNAGQLATLLGADDLPAVANQMAFGDGVLDVCDVYLSFLRSIDGNFVLFQRFWNNGQRVAQPLANIAPNSNIAKQGSPVQTKGLLTNGPAPQINFSVGDFQGSPGQTVSVPITATVYGNYPARAVMFNVTVNALDGSPALTSPLQFVQTAAALGSPASFSLGANGNNYSLVWLNITNAGITGSTIIGNLSFTIPATATANSAYDINFTHASASPNGFISLPRTIYTGLITLSSRTNSSYGDSIPDSWRLRWFGTTNNILSVSNACASSDGIDNWQKYIAGVDPTIPNDFPHLLPKAPVPSGSTSAIHWPTVNGVQYVIERSYNLYGGWTPVNTNTGTGTDMEFDDSTSGGARFYRVRILP